MALTKTETTMPLAEAGHCLSKRLEGRQIVVSTLRGSGAFELTRICWTHKPNARNGNAFQLARNSLDTLQPKDKRFCVCRDFTAARCDQRANKCK